jgi:hypothetical protein
MRDRTQKRSVIDATKTRPYVPLVHAECCDAHTESKSHKRKVTAVIAFGRAFQSLVDRGASHRSRMFERGFEL